MGYGTTVSPNIRVIFFVASPVSEGLCSVKYWYRLDLKCLTALLTLTKPRLKDPRPGIGKKKRF
jgi:hypothetical protein